MNLKMTKKKSPLPYWVNSSCIYIARKTFHQIFKGSCNIVPYSLEIMPPPFCWLGLATSMGGLIIEYV